MRSRAPFRVGKSGFHNGGLIIARKLPGSNDLLVHGLEVTASPVDEHRGRRVYLRMSFTEATELRDTLSALLDES